MVAVLIRLAGLLIFVRDARSACSSSVCHDLEKGVPSGFQKISYAESSELLQNPRRGFWDEMTTKASSFHAVGMGDLRWRRDTKGVVVINRMFVMDLFRTKSLTSDFLSKIRTDLFTIREGKMTTVLRFCYIFESHDHPPYGDASKNVMLNHIKQLSPILHEFDDVIDAIQAGFIGAWGEWYYTDAFGSPQERDFHKYSSTHGYSPQHIADRKQILEALIDAVPNTIQIMQRYPSWNRMIFGTTPPTLHDVQTHSNKGRVGFHNDCFLSTKNDEGTYSDGIDVDYPYLHEQTKYLLAGGETCSGAKQNPDRHKCSTALHEMALFHWSFLNVEYYKPVLQDWQKHGCFNDIYRRMGYRFVLKEAVMPRTVHHGSDFCFRIVLRNEGFAAPARNWNILLVLKQGSATHAVSLPGHDMRLWLPGQDIVIEHSVHVPTNVSSTETYDTFLVFEDQKIPHESDYSILLANDHVPDHHSGMNNLAHKIVVNGGSGHTSSCPSFRRWTPPKASTHRRVVTQVHI